MKTRVWLLAGLAWVPVVFSAAYATWDRGWWRPAVPDEERFITVGVDVSHHQGRVDWKQVASEPNLSFAYLKATEGGDFVDPEFAHNWRDATAAGLKVGAYHFFTFCTSASEQAEHFLSHLPPQQGALPPALDVEFGGNCRHGARDVWSVRPMVAEWLDRVEAALGKRPLLYLTEEARVHFYDDTPPPAPVWMRSLWGEPGPETPWVMWQFANRARVAGIRGPVDLNTLPGTLLSL